MAVFRCWLSRFHTGSMRHELAGQDRRVDRWQGWSPRSGDPANCQQGLGGWRQAGCCMLPFLVALASSAVARPGSPHRHLIAGTCSGELRIKRNFGSGFRRQRLKNRPTPTLPVRGAKCVPMVRTSANLPREPAAPCWLLSTSRRRHHLNKLQHQIGSFGSSQPLNHAGFRHVVVATRRCRKIAESRESAPRGRRGRR